MAIYEQSRYALVEQTQIEDADGERNRVYNLPQTTVLPEALPVGTEKYTVNDGETFESIAHKEYQEMGGSNIAWVLAYCNPHVAYPLDLAGGDVIYLPPPRWIESFIYTADDWETTWRANIRS